MIVQDLRKILKGVPGNMEVLIPANALDGFTGEWFSPCMCDTGVSELGIGDEDADEDNVEVTSVFIIVPHAYFEESEMVGPNPELN